MADFVTDELVRLLLSVALGAGFAVVYDVFRIARRAVKHSYAVMSGEDMLFWIVAGVVAFFFFLFQDNGKFRLYTVMGILAGIFAYRMTLSRLLVPFFAKILRNILKISTNLLQKLKKRYKIRKSNRAKKRNVKKGGKIEKRKASREKTVQ